MQYDWTSLITILLTIITTVGTLTWWLAKQFSSVRALVYKKIEQVQTILTTKLELHENIDNERFNSINNDLWEIRVRNAEKDGQIIKRRKYKGERINGYNYSNA